MVTNKYKAIAGSQTNIQHHQSFRHTLVRLRYAIIFKSSSGIFNRSINITYMYYVSIHTIHSASMRYKVVNSLSSQCSKCESERHTLLKIQCQFKTTHDTMLLKTFINSVRHSTLSGSDDAQDIRYRSERRKRASSKH